MVIEGDANSISLRLASALGAADMHWGLSKINPAQDPQVVRP
jgi:hypothetical protein